MRGTVKWFNDAKGYGFITAEDGTDIFVHHTAIQMGGRRRLEPGQRVEFKAEDSVKGQSAVEVVRL